MREAALAAEVLCPYRQDPNGRYLPFKTHTLLSVHDLPSSWGSG